MGCDAAGLDDHAPEDGVNEDAALVALHAALGDDIDICGECGEPFDVHTHDEVIRCALTVEQLRERLRL